MKITNNLEFIKEAQNCISNLFSISSQEKFESLAIRIFKLQYDNNITYREYVDLLKIKPKDIKKLEDIPFMPISFFKNKKIISKDLKHQVIFYSSGTTGSVHSKHYVADRNIYKNSFMKSFEYFYGNVQDYCFLALLPGYLERKGSSLVYMVNEMIKVSGLPDNGFYLNEFELLKKKIQELKLKRQKYILIGVTYALLDFSAACSMELSDGIVMETGGMKGTRKEMIKTEVHQILKDRFKINQVHSEYGMTELLSQAYSNGDGLYTCPPWMKIKIRDIYDPFSYANDGISGGINVIDLANIYSCSFIETQDLGKIHMNGQFEISGRFDQSEIRGCNLLVV